MDWSEQQAKYGGLKLAETQKPKDTKGRGGFLTSLISEAAGALGGVGGLLVGGPVGAAAGAGLGSTLGSALEQKVRDDKVDLGKASKEGAFSAATAALPVGKILKGGASVVKGGAKPLAAQITQKGTTDVVEAGVEQANRGFLNRVSSRAKYADQKSSGLRPGQSMGGGDVLSPEYADELHNFLREGSKKYVPGGVRAGAPIEQATSANKVFNGVNTKLDESLKAINRKIDDNEADSIIQNVDFKLLGDENVTGKTALADKFKQLVKGKDLASLEKLRRGYDKTAYTATGAGKTAKAAEARVLRDAIDEFVTPLSPEYKAIKGDWKLASDALRLTSKGSAAAKGAKIPLIGVEVGEQAIPGAVSKGGAFLSRVAGGAPEQVTSTPSRSTGNILTRVLAGRAADTASQTPENMQEVVPHDNTDINTSELALEPERSTNPFVPENAQASVQKILAQGGDMKDVAAYLANVEALQKLGGSGGAKALNSTASGVVADTKTGLKALQDLNSEIEASNANNPLIGQLRSKNPFDTGAQNLQANVATAKQIVGKALEGGVLRKEDETKYAKLLPTMGDTDSVAKYKIERLTDLISSRLAEYQRNISGGSGGTDLAELGI